MSKCGFTGCTADHRRDPLALALLVLYLLVTAGKYAAGWLWSLWR